MNISEKTYRDHSILTGDRGMFLFYVFSYAKRYSDRLGNTFALIDLRLSQHISDYRKDDRWNVSLHGCGEFKHSVKAALSVFAMAKLLIPFCVR